MDMQTIVDQYKQPIFDDSGTLACSINSPAQEDLILGHESLVSKAQCSNGLSSVSEPSVMQTFDNTDRKDESHKGQSPPFLKSV